MLQSQAAKPSGARLVGLLLDQQRQGTISAALDSSDAELQCVAFCAVQGLVWRALAREHWCVFAATGVLKVFHDCIMFSQPIILEQLLHHLSSARDRWVALGLAGALFGAAMLEALTVNIYFHALFRCELGCEVGRAKVCGCMAGTLLLLCNCLHTEPH
jgi:hypothetical protein